jgi:hypothetical protein
MSITEAVVRMMLACAHRDCVICTAWMNRWLGTERSSADPGE